MIDFLTQSPHFYDYVAYAVIFLGLFNFGEVALLLYNKARVERAERRKSDLKRLASTALITEEDPAAVLPEPSAEEDFAAYSEAAVGVLDSFEGEIADKAKALISRLGVEEHYRRMARHRAWYKRGNAVDILASFKLPSNEEFLVSLFRDERVPDVKYRIIYALSFLAKDHSDIRRLALMLSSLPYLTAKYTEDVFYNIINRLRAADKSDEFGLFMQETLDDKRVSASVKRDILTACQAAMCERGRGLLRSYYSSHPDNPEILIGALKALAAIGDFGVIPEALTHKDWRVRMTALKSADLCCLDMLPEIKAMLRDNNYHVRLEAAMTLARAGKKGTDALREEKDSGDKFASETAAYALTQVKP